jgi:hypothetical protein
VFFELTEDLMEHLAGFRDHIVPDPFLLLYLLHVRIQRLGHLGFDDGIGVILQCVNDRPPHQGGPHRVPLDVTAGEELPHHLMTGTLCSQSQLLHTLDEPTLAVPRRGLGLLGLQDHLP